MLYLKNIKVLALNFGFHVVNYVFEGEHSYIIRISFLPEKAWKNLEFDNLDKKNLKNLEFEQLKKTKETWNIEQKYLNFY